MGDGIQLVVRISYRGISSGLLLKFLQNSFRMQKMSRRAWLLNWFVGKASKKPAIQEMMTEMIASKEAQENLHSPWFMFKTLMF